MGHLRCRTALLVGVSLWPMAHAKAQADATSPQSGQAQQAPLEGEIIVTAQRRSERLRDVPISITAVTAEKAELAGVIDVTTLSALVPNMTMMVSVSGFTPSIRGIGAVGTGSAPHEEQPVATYVDGVYIAAPSAAATFGFNNIQRIEVLKGPQGTLFGRNATGGVIQVVTLEPQQEFGGKVSVGYGNYNTYEGKGYITGGLANGIAADLSVSYENRGDGFGRNFTTGLPTFTKDEVAVRGSILIPPTDSTHIRLAADYSNLDFNGPEFQQPKGTIGVDSVPTSTGRFNGVGENPIHTHLRSEEHTSELQSLMRISYAVFCLKKKKKNK